MDTAAASPHFAAASRCSARDAGTYDATARAAADAARVTSSLMEIPAVIWRGLAEASAMCLVAPPARRER